MTELPRDALDIAVGKHQPAISTLQITSPTFYH